MWLTILEIIGCIIALGFISIIFYLLFAAIFGMFNALLFLITLGQYNPYNIEKDKVEKEYMQKNVKHPTFF